jgi:hypothetical protein
MHTVFAISPQIRQEARRSHMARLLSFLLLLATVFLAGCANETYDRNNELWRQGYGYNNPNAANLRQGKKLSDF